MANKALTMSNHQQSIRSQSADSFASIIGIGCGRLMDDLWWAIVGTPRTSVCFTCKNQILKAMYMQITNSFSGESKNHLLNFSHHQRKLSCTQALSEKEFAHYQCTLCSLWGAFARYPFDKEWDLLIKPCWEREACVNKASLAALGCVGRRRLKLIGNVIISRESFTAVLHLWQQL